MEEFGLRCGWNGKCFLFNICDIVLTYVITPISYTELFFVILVLSPFLRLYCAMVIPLIICLCR